MICNSLTDESISDNGEVTDAGVLPHPKNPKKSDVNTIVRR
jgi:hypothetical protein